MNQTEEKPLTALVVDDEPAFLQMLSQLLADVSFATTCSDSGAGAIKALQERPFDLLIVDIGLPDMNGMHICEVARARYGASITIFVVTADDRVERRVTALELGADDFLGKPFDIEELLVRIAVKLQRMDKTIG